MKTYVGFYLILKTSLNIFFISNCELLIYYIIFIKKQREKFV